MHVLLVTYYFPPAGGGGVQRPLGWCRFLPEAGIQVTVVAPDAPQWVDADPTLTVPGTTRVIRTPDPSPPAVLPKAELARARGPLQRLVTRARLQPRRLAMPDVNRRWRKPAVTAALVALTDVDADTTPIDLVISTSPPETTHLVGRDIAAALNVPWVADYRDSWLDLPHLRLQSRLVRLKHRAQIKLAIRVMRDAAAALTVSEPLALDLRRRHPGLPVHVIENGVDLDASHRARNRSSGFRESDFFVALYTGNFFGVQSPAHLLDAAELVITRRPDLAETLRIRFVGGVKASDETRVSSSPTLTQVIQLCGFVRHDDVMASQAAADLLLLYVAPGAGSTGVYTGKIFEYLATRRPVLAMAPADNVAATLADAAGVTQPATGGGRVDPDDVPAIAAALEHAHDLWAERHAIDTGGHQLPTVDVPDEIIERIDRRKQSQRLATLLSDLV